MSGNSASRDSGASSGRPVGGDAGDLRDLARLGERLESLYAALNRREYVHPDPIEFLYDHEDPADREIVALVASALAYGRVEQINASVAAALARFGSTPARFVADASRTELERSFAGFKHRFATGDDLAAMLAGAGAIARCHGTLGARFAALVRDDDETVVPALTAFAAELGGEGGIGHLVPCPGRGSACKRFHLLLRWMVRKDAVDPGGWDGVDVAKLVVPLDVHMHRIALRLGLTKRRSADRRTALEVTRGFARFRPDDPVRYDFALTRLGIRKDVPLEYHLERGLDPPERGRT